MTAALERSLDASPPTDLEAERMFLGSLLIVEQNERNAATLLVRPDAFHDPFHAWLFRGLRQARHAATVAEVTAFLSHEIDRPEWIGSNFAFWIASLIIRRDGKFKECDHRRLRSYAERINTKARRRDRIAELENELFQLIYQPGMEHTHG